jgi:hypothetical protein
VVGKILLKSDEITVSELNDGKSPHAGSSMMKTAGKSRARDALKKIFLMILISPSPLMELRGATKMVSVSGKVGGRMWESNPPGPFIRSRTGFEVQRGHQTPCPPAHV